MNLDDDEQEEREGEGDAAPGDPSEVAGKTTSGIRGYAIGLALAATLTALSFTMLGSELVWQPAIPQLLIVLAVAQMGVHLVFFIHITSAPDHTNTVLALAYGVFIVLLVIGGSVWIMANLDASMLPMHEIMNRQR